MLGDALAAARRLATTGWQVLQLMEKTAIAAPLLIKA